MSESSIRPETAREFLVRALGDAHELHTVVARWGDKTVIGMRCSCRAVIEFDPASDNGKAAEVALKNVPPLRVSK